MKPTQEQIIAWAKKADFSDDEIKTCFDGFILLAEFAYEAGRKDENEECAAICDHEMDNAMNLGMKVAAGNCADKIRAMGEK